MKEAKALEVILIRLLLTSVCVLNTVSEEFIENPMIRRGETQTNIAIICCARVCREVGMCVCVCAYMFVICPSCLLTALALLTEL